MVWGFNTEFDILVVERLVRVSMKNLIYWWE